MNRLKKNTLLMALILAVLNVTTANAAADSTPTINELPDKLNTIIDTLADDSEVKYYSFTAVRGQRVLINEINAKNSPWLIEYKEGDTWQTKYGDEAFATPNMNPGQKVQLRVSKKPQHSLPKDARYEIHFGSAPRVADIEVTGDAEHFKVQFGKNIAYRIFNWQTRVLDYKGHPLEGVRVTLELNTDQEANSSHTTSHGLSNKSGFIRTTFSLPACHGKKATAPFWLWQHGFRTKWQLTYNPGYWYMYPVSYEKGGIGSKNGDKPSFVHICTQKIIR